MSLVTLEDGTLYYLDTDSEFNAREIIEYKLNQRLDFRQIDNVEVVEDIKMDKESKCYNSGNQFDGKELKCVKGWNYRWE